MKDLLQKGFYLGLGAGMTLKEGLEKAAGDLTRKGEAATRETGKMGQDVMDELQRQLDDLQSKGAEAFERQVADTGIATRREMLALEQRIKELEAKLAAVETRLAGA